MANNNDNAGIGGLFGGLGKLLELAQELQKNAQNGSSSETTFTTPSGLNGVFGVNIRTVNGEARVEPFGNVVKNDAGARVDAIREPLTDVLEDDAGYTIIVELPGVDPNSIRVTLDGSTLEVTASGASGRQYAKTLELTRAVNASSLRRSYQNGILELTAPFSA
jgi:HSP20 family protein